jgi:hypothetical protein
MIDPEQIAASLTAGEIKHLNRLATSSAPLARRTGWKARAIMMKGLSEWADYKAGTERLTDLGLAVRAIIERDSK